MKEYQDLKLPYVKTEYGVAGNGVVIGVGNLQEAEELLFITPMATNAVIVERTVSDWIKLER